MNQFTGLRIPWHNSGTAILTFLKRAFTGVQAELAFTLFRIRAMTMETFVAENRTYIPIKVDTHRHTCEDT